MLHSRQREVSEIFFVQYAHLCDKLVCFAPVKNSLFLFFEGMGGARLGKFLVILVPTRLV